jgi:hypothetical protein
MTGVSMTRMSGVDEDLWIFRSFSFAWFANREDMSIFPFENDVFCGFGVFCGIGATVCGLDFCAVFAGEDDRFGLNIDKNPSILPLG